MKTPFKLLLAVVAIALAAIYHQAIANFIRKGDLSGFRAPSVGYQSPMFTPSSPISFPGK
jgi:hypothetical protein